MNHQKIKVGFHDWLREKGIDPGEGIYQAGLLSEVVTYNRILEKVMKAFRLAGPLKGALQELLVFLMTRKWVRSRVNAGFSG